MKRYFTAATTPRRGAALWRAPIAALVVTMGLALVVASSEMASTAGAAGTTQEGSSAQAAEPAASRPVAGNPQGQLRSRVVGTTANDRRVTGSFVPLRFVRKAGTVRVRGLLHGVVHNANGSTSTFTGLRTLRLRDVNGVPAANRAVAAAAAPCDVLHLRLAPLDLDLLGLVVHLDRVVLDIVAETGAGKLLGNLVCAITGLLDGGLDGLLGRLTRLLNQVLGALRLGV